MPLIHLKIIFTSITIYFILHDINQQMAERKYIVKTKIKSNYLIKFMNNKNILSIPSHSDANELHDAVNSALSIAKSFKRSISAVSVATAMTTLQTKLYRLL